MGGEAAKERRRLKRLQAQQNADVKGASSGEKPGSGGSTPNKTNKDKANNGEKGRSADEIVRLRLQRKMARKANGKFKAQSENSPPPPPSSPPPSSVHKRKSYDAAADGKTSKWSKSSSSGLPNKKTFNRSPRNQSNPNQSKTHNNNKHKFRNQKDNKQKQRPAKKNDKSKHKLKAKVKKQKPKHLKRKMDQLSKTISEGGGDDLEDQMKKLVKQMAEYKKMKNQNQTTPEAKKDDNDKAAESKDDIETTSEESKDAAIAMEDVAPEDNEEGDTENKENEKSEDPSSSSSDDDDDDDEEEEPSSTSKKNKPTKESSTPTTSTSSSSSSDSNSSSNDDDDSDSEDEDTIVADSSSNVRSRGKRRRGRRGDNNNKEDSKNDNVASNESSKTATTESSKPASEEEESQEMKDDLDDKATTSGSKEEDESQPSSSKKTSKKDDKRRCIGRKPVTDYTIGQTYTGTINYIKPKLGAFIDIGSHSDAFCHISCVSNDYVSSVDNVLKVGEEVQNVRILEIDREKKRITVSLRSVDMAENEVERLKTTRQYENKGSSHHHSKNKRIPGKSGHVRFDHRAESKTNNAPSEQHKNTNNDGANDDSAAPTSNAADLKRERKLARRAERRAQKEPHFESDNTAPTNTAKHWNGSSQTTTQRGSSIPPTMAQQKSGANLKRERKLARRAERRAAKEAAANN